MQSRWASTRSNNVHSWDTWRPWDPKQTCNHADTIKEFSQRAVELSDRRVHFYEREAANHSLVPPEIAADLERAKAVQAMNHKIAAIDSIRAKMTFVAMSLKRSPFPIIDRHLRRLYEAQSEVLNGVDVYGAKDNFTIKASGTRLAKQVVEDINKTRRLCTPALRAYAELKRSLSIIEDGLIKLGRLFCLKSSSVFQYCNLELSHELNSVRAMYYDGLVARHAHQDERRWIYEAFRQRAWKPIQALTTLAKKYHRMVTAVSTSAGSTKANKVAVLRRNRCQERHRRLRLDVISLTDCIEDLLCIISARIEMIPDSQLPKLVERAKEEMASMEHEENEQRDRLDDIRLGHKAERAAERKAERAEEKRKRELKKHGRMRKAASLSE